MRTSIRLARAADQEAIARVHVTSTRTLCARAYRPAELARWLSVDPGLYRRLLETTTVFVATQRREVVGFVAVSLAGREIRALYVDPRCAGQGVGAQLLGRAERSARAFGLREICLAATLNAVTFYKRYGWESVAEIPGIKPCRIRMEKKLLYS